jgi:hypothetical protein
MKITRTVQDMKVVDIPGTKRGNILIGKTNELQTNSKNIRELHTGISDFKRS